MAYVRAKQSEHAVVAHTKLIRAHSKMIKGGVPHGRVRNTPLRIARFLGESQVRWLVHKDPREYGTWLRKEMVEMGPAFVKLGQFLSTRSDLFDAELKQELAKLQDSIDPVPYEDVVYMLESSTGKKLGDTFLRIDEDCMASASIGQVHHAVLLSGEEVVVKVQKPDVAGCIQNDISTLRWMNHVLVQAGSPRAREVEDLLEQYERFLSGELDYRKERIAMDRFARAADADGLPVRIPKTFADCSSREVLVMEYVPSVKITNLPEILRQGGDPERLASDLVYVFLYLVVYHGLVHCDPHPGNLGVDRDGETIVLYDFGNTFELGEAFRSKISHLLFSISQKDVDEFVDILIQLRVLHVSGDPLELVDIKGFFRSFFGYLETLDFSTLRSAIAGQEILSSFQSSARQKVNLDQNFLSLFRVFSLLDGTCSLLDPNFNYFRALAPFSETILRDPDFVQNRIVRDMQKLQNYGTIAQRTDENILRVQQRVKNIQAQVTHGYRIVLGVLAVTAFTVQDERVWLSCGVAAVMLWMQKN